jgi:hypothetical protein
MARGTGAAAVTITARRDDGAIVVQAAAVEDCAVLIAADGTTMWVMPPGSALARGNWKGVAAGADRLPPEVEGRVLALLDRDGPQRCGGRATLREAVDGAL